jgi:hypothetical protein
MPSEQNASMMWSIFGLSSPVKERWLDQAVPSFLSLEVDFSSIAGFAGQHCCRQLRLEKMNGYGTSRTLRRRPRDVRFGP